MADLHEELTTFTRVLHEAAAVYEFMGDTKGAKIQEGIAGVLDGLLAGTSLEDELDRQVQAIPGGNELVEEKSREIDNAINARLLGFE